MFHYETAAHPVQEQWRLFKPGQQQAGRNRGGLGTKITATVHSADAVEVWRQNMIILAQRTSAWTRVQEIKQVRAQTRLPVMGFESTADRQERTGHMAVCVCVCGCLCVCVSVSVTIDLQEQAAVALCSFLPVPLTCNRQDHVDI